MLLVYKLSSVGLATAALMMGGLAFYHATANPVVVVERCEEKSFYDGKREKIKVTDEDVKAFIQNWIKLRYTWLEFDPDKITKQISPLSTEGFQAKLKDTLGKKKAENTKDQKIEESVTGIQATLSDKEAMASFERIVRINGIALIAPTEVTLQIIQGTSTKWNPLGLYVNGVVEREEK